MDTTETYIKMCEKAEEIQPCLDDKDGVGGTWVSSLILYHTAPMNQPHNRDGYYHVTDEVAVRRCEQCGNEDDYIKSSRAIWLPRQDQLQEMVFGTGQTWEGMAIVGQAQTILDFGNELWSESEKVRTAVPQTWEQLWLAFVMKEKYQKIWNDEDWVLNGNRDSG